MEKAAAQRARGAKISQLLTLMLYDRNASMASCVELDYGH